MLMASIDARRSRPDWRLVGGAAALVAIGTLTIASAAGHLAGGFQLLARHFFALGLGVLAFLAGMGLNYQVYQDQSRLAYGLALAVLIAVLLFGDTLRGTRGWFRLPWFSIQPSEIARLLILFVLAEYLSRRDTRAYELRTTLGALALMMPPMLLILLQPDLSCLLVLFPAILVVLFCAGATVWHLAALAGCGTLTFVLPLIWTYLSLKPEKIASGLEGWLWSLSSFGLPFLLALAAVAAALAGLTWVLNRLRLGVPWTVPVAVFLVVGSGLVGGVCVQHALKDYQRKRFLSFIAPEADPLGSGYNLRQSQIAVGSGGLWGKGMFSSTQTRLGFLPERHTDFIFAVIGEETGFLGALLTLGLYLYLLWRLVVAARLARDDFGYLLACGLVGLFGTHLVVNTGMAVGLVPVVGVPLPMVSYGGSSLVASLWALGVAQSIYARRLGFTPVR